MAVFSRKVDVLWNGGIMDGNGEAKAGTGAFSLPVTFPSRIGEPAGSDQPRRAARRVARRVLRDGVQRHARAATTPRPRPRTSPRRSARTRPTPASRWCRRRSKCVVTGLEGTDAAGLAELAKKAEGGCPISNAIRGNVAVTVKTSIAQSVVCWGRFPQNRRGRSGWRYRGAGRAAAPHRRRRWSS